MLWLSNTVNVPCKVFSCHWLKLEVQGLAQEHFRDPNHCTWGHIHDFFTNSCNFFVKKLPKSSLVRGTGIQGSTELCLLVSLAAVMKRYLNEEYTVLVLHRTFIYMSPNWLSKICEFLLNSFNVTALPVIAMSALRCAFMNYTTSLLWSIAFFFVVL